MKIKRILTILLTLALMVTYMPAFAFADDTAKSGSAGDDLTWTLSDDGTLTISGTGEMKVDEDLFYDLNENTTIKKLVLEEGVTAVCKNAFTYCEDISEVYLPLSLKDIGEDAFYDCYISDIYYAGSYDEWNSIIKRDGNWELNEADIHLYYGTDKQDDLIIVYNLDEGTLDGRPEYMVEELGECTENYELPIPVRTGYSFEYWYDSDYDEVAEIKAGTKGTVILWAEWEGLDCSDYVDRSTVIPDISTAVNGSIYSADPIKVHTDTDSDFEVTYAGREVGADYDGPYEVLTEKYGLSFGKDGKISGTVNASEDKCIELKAGVAEKKDGALTGYNEYTLWLNIATDPEKYEVPDDAAEMDLTKVNGGGWYKNVSTSGEWEIPYYTYTVAKGETKWVKFRVASDILIVESGSAWRTPTKVIGADGYERYDHSDEFGIGKFPTNPGETYYIYVDNTGGSEDEVVYVNDCGSHERTKGSLGDWKYKKIKSKVANPFVKNSGKDWDVYRIGTLDNPYKWTINGFDTGLYYYCGVDVISKNPVYYSGPAFESNFGTNYSVYKNNYLVSAEKNKKLATGEKHHKINYKIRIADTEYVTDRQNTCNIDIYVPAGTVFTKDKDSFLHTAIAKTSLKSVAKAKKAFTAKWTKKTGVSGYEIQYGLKSNFSGARKVKVSSATATSKKITNLKAKKKYYVRIRTYRKVGTSTYYSAWSAKKAVTTN